MVLADTQLMELVRAGYLPESVEVGPCSVDLRLGVGFLAEEEVEIQYLDREVKMVYVDSGRYLLRPSELVLATTMERVRIPRDMAAMVHGRSSVGRMGLQVQNAGFVDAGFEGEITLELVNQSRNPIMLEAGWRICQLSFHQLSEESVRPYAGKYQFQRGARASELWRDGL